MLPVRSILLSLVALVALGLFALVRFVLAPATHWTDAYVALGAIDGASDRVAIANAMVDSEPPPGLNLESRVHPAGSLVRIRYETFDEEGRQTDRWHVRALVPPLPALPDNHGEHALLGTRCAPACTAEAERGATILQRSGEAGLAHEWVLRMPVGRPFDIGSRPLTTHDLFDERPRRLAIESGLREGRQFRHPANIRVTVVEVCHARVRLGSSNRLEVFPNAIIPIPKGFRTYRWVQLDGCGGMLAGTSP